MQLVIFFYLFLMFHVGVAIFDVTESFENFANFFRTKQDPSVGLDP